MERYDIHIAFAEKKMISLCLSGYEKSVHIPALLKDIGFGRIDVFGLTLSHNSSAETYHLSVHILNRKHDPVPEKIMYAGLFLEGDNPAL